MIKVNLCFCVEPTLQSTQVSYAAVSIYTSAFALLCSYTTRPLVGDGVSVPLRSVSSLLFSTSLVFETMATETERISTESELTDVEQQF